MIRLLNINFAASFAAWFPSWVLAGALLCGAAGCQKESPGASTRPADQASQRALPVIGAAARKGDMAIYLDALGTVTPLQTVMVRPRVDGTLNEVRFVEGQFIKQDELLAEIDPRPFQVQLEQAEAQMAKDQAALANGRADLARYQAAKEAISKQQLDTQLATVQQFEAATKIDQAQIDSAQLQITYCRITAPITGRVGLRLMDRGNMVHASDSTGIVVITQVQPITVVFAISEDDLLPVLKKTRDGASLRVEAYDRSFKNKLGEGELSAIDNQVDSTTGTVKLKATFPNGDLGLFPNQFVNARLEIDTLHNVVIVPSAAVQHGPDSLFVYVVGDQGAVEVRPVTLGPVQGDDTVIQSGITAGEMVVTDGVDKLEAGKKVTVRTPATRPAAAVSTSQSK